MLLMTHHSHQGDLRILFLLSPVESPTSIDGTISIDRIPASSRQAYVVRGL